MYARRGLRSYAQRLHAIDAVLDFPANLGARNGLVVHGEFFVDHGWKNVQDTFGESPLEQLQRIERLLGERAGLRHCLGEHLGSRLDREWSSLVFEGSAGQRVGGEHEFVCKVGSELLFEE